MRCFDEGTLRAYLDRELPARQSDEVARHLGGCADCRARLAELEENAKLVGANLATLAPSAADAESDPARARVALRRRLNQEEPVRLGGRLGSALAGLRAALSPARLAAGAVPVALAAALLLTPAGSYAQDFLSIFRVQQVQAITIDESELSSLPGVNDLGKLTTSAKPQLRSVTVADAGKSAGLTPLGVSAVPSGFSTKPLAFVSQPITATYTYDYAKVQAYYQKQGLSAKPPAELAGLTVETSISPVAVLVYGDQEALAQVQSAASGASGGAKETPTAQNAHFIALVQTHTPNVQVPSNVDVGKLREQVLASGAIPQELASQLSAIQDWQHTLPVPTLKDGSKTVTVDGVSGVLTTSPEGGSFLIWQKGDVSYGLFGTVSEAELLAAANSLAVAK